MLCVCQKQGQRDNYVVSGAGWEGEMGEVRAGFGGFADFSKGWISFQV